MIYFGQVVPAIMLKCQQLVSKLIILQLFQISMSVQNTDQSTPRPCADCGIFFGTEASDWMCSSCYKEKANLVKRKESALTNVSQKPEIMSIQPEEPKKQVPTIDKTRCFKCNKRVGLLGVECKCTMVYCNLHRMPESHECGIDYKKLGRQKLSKEHQVVAPSKITEI